MSTLDTALDAARKIVDAAQDNLGKIHTEEDVKFQIISRLIVESLGWSHAAVRAESRHENGYSDYIISDGEKKAVLIEAKRIGRLDIAIANKEEHRVLRLDGSSKSKRRYTASRWIRLPKWSSNCCFNRRTRLDCLQTSRCG